MRRLYNYILAFSLAGCLLGFYFLPSYHMSPHRRFDERFNTAGLLHPFLIDRGSASLAVEWRPSGGTLAQDKGGDSGAAHAPQDLS